MNNLEAMSPSDLSDLEVKHRRAASFSEQVAIIIGLEGEAPDFERDKSAAYILEEWLLAHGCHIQRDIRYKEIPGRGPLYLRGRYTRENRSFVTLISGGWNANGDGRGFSEQRADHCLALCWAVLKYLTSLQAMYDAPDTYCGRDPSEETAQSLDFEAQARETIHNPRGR